MKPFAPRKDRFGSIDPLQFVAAYLAKAQGALSIATVGKHLGPYLDEGTLARCLEALENRREITRENGRVRIGQDAAEGVRARFGKDKGEPWSKLRDGRFVLLALGMDPDDRLARIRKGRADLLRALVIAVGYGVELPAEKLTPETVRAEMVTRVLRMHMPDIVGRDPLPIQGKATALERVLLGGLVGMRPRNINEAWAAVAAAAAGLADRSIEALRVGLVRNALAQSGVPRANASIPEGAEVRSNFPERVLAVARRLTETDQRFAGRASIAAVYDAYGRAHADAGRISDFKTRLVEAARRRELSLERLDLPELLTDDERSRSAAPWGDDHRHLIVTGR